MKKRLLIFLLVLSSLLFAQTTVRENWTLVKQDTNVWKISKIDDTKSYYYSLVDTGATAPTTEKGIYFDNLSFESSSIDSVDIYLKVLKGEGLILVEKQPIISNQQEPSFRDYVAKDYYLAIQMGQIEGHSIVDKFGENPDIDTGTIPEDIWEQGGLYIYDADGTAPIVSIVSDSALDTMPIEIQGLDINGDFTKQNITLTGTTRAVLTTPLWRVYRMSNEGTTSIDGMVKCYIGTSNTPLDSEIRAIIDDGNNQTLMALYTIPKGKVGFLVRGELGGSRSQTAGAIQCAYYSRRYGKVFKIKKRVDITNQGSSIYQDIRTAPDPIPSLTDVKLVVEDVTANNTGTFGTFDIMLVDEDLFPVEYLQSIGQVGY